MNVVCKLFAIMLGVLLLGCSSNQQTVEKEKSTKTEATKVAETSLSSETQKIDEVKTEAIAKQESVTQPSIPTEIKTVETSLPQPVEMPPVKVETPAVSTSEKVASSNAPWVLVFKSNELIEPDEKAQILALVKEKWFQDKQYEEVAFQNYEIEKYVGRKVALAEARRSEGKYEFTIRSGKIILDGKDVVEEPLSKQDGPDGQVHHRRDLADLLREIKAL